MSSIKNQKPYLPNQNPLWLFELGHHIGCYAGALGVAEVLQYASGQ